MRLSWTRGVVAAITAITMLTAPGAAGAAAPDHGGPTARAASGLCSIGGSGVTYNRRGQAAVFKNLRALGKMNCASARYVMNGFLRASYRRGSSNRIPTRFFDGYVTWHCSRYTPHRWQCNEYTSNTSFRFVAYHL